MMARHRARGSALSLLGILLAGVSCSRAKGPDYSLTPVPLTSVRLTDAFWAPRQKTDLEVTIDHEIGQIEETGRIRNFELAAAALRGAKGGAFQTRYAFDDSDVYKLIEAAGYALMLEPDPGLEEQMDGWIAKIAAAQEPDGYLYTARTIDPGNPHRMSGPARWSNLPESHELYNLGHLYEAAVAYVRATGKRALLDVALKSADLLLRTFGPEDGKLKLVPGHEEVEMGLVKLFRETGDRRFLRLAKFFIDQRGNAAGHPLYGEYAQDHRPVLEQTEAVGHSVRAAYLYSGMVDVAALSGDPRYLEPLDKIWEDIVSRKLYLTGGIGAAGGIEGFGPPYELPNPTGYAETCATIAYALWNWRMALFHGDAKYMDLFERAAYNAFLSGAGMSGDRFFYPNPLASYGQHERTPWFSCACCPPNVARFIAELGGFAYAVEGDRIYVNMYVQGTAGVAAGPGRVTLEQRTEYPWNGDISIRVSPPKPAELTLLLRVPGWALGRPLPSDLYAYLESGTAIPPVTLKVNGEPLALTIEKGYAVVRRTWAAGDTVELSLPMPVRRVVANPKVASDEGRVAVERGPLVYCAEFVDNGGRVANLVLEDGAPLAAEPRPGLLGGITVVTGEAKALAVEKGKPVGTPRELTLIPYYAWAHRGRGEMTVWLAREASKARPETAPDLASRATVTASEGAQNLRGINDSYDPESSADPVGYLHWWPKKGSEEWVEYAFVAPVRVSEASVYWFDDSGTGECRVPASWDLLYRVGGEWRPVRASGPYGTAKDAYNTVRFAPVTTEALRLVVRLAAGASSGIQAWRIK